MMRRAVALKMMGEGKKRNKIPERADENAGMKKKEGKQEEGTHRAIVNGMVMLCEETKERR